MDECEAETRIDCARPGLSAALIFNCDGRHHHPDDDAPWLHHDPEFGMDWYRKETEKPGGLEDSP